MNNRLIKFRFWNKKYKQWVNPYVQYPLFWFNSTGEVTVSSLSCGQHYVMQQFTGLIDKNNKAIYEGDIVKWYHGVEDIGEVKYYINDNIGPAMTYFGLNVERLGACQFQSDDKYEVIGNIFEK